MMTTARVAVLVLLAALCACGKPGDKQGKSGQAPPEGVKKEDGQAGAEPSKGPDGPTLKKAPARGPEHAVYSLFDNRLSAHRQRAGGLLVSGGSAGFVRYMRFGRSSLNWDVREERDGIKVSRMSGKTGRLIIPLSKSQATGEQSIRLRAFSPSSQRLGIRINGDRKQEVAVEIAQEGFSTIELKAPAGTLVAGENELLLFASKSPLEVAWLQVAGAEAADDVAPFFDVKGSRIALAENHGLAYYVMAPKDGRVVGNLAEPGCEIAVSASNTAGKSITGTLVGTGSAVELGDVGGTVVRLELVAKGCKSASLADAALAVSGKAPTVKKAAPPKHVILLIIDSLRADHLKPFNPKARPEVPTLEALSESASFFQQAYVQGNESRASHASMWTSTYPVVHRMIPGGNPKGIDNKWFTIDELMNAQGKFTFGVSANGYITPKRGFGTKWDKYRNHIHDGGGLTAERLLTKVWEILEGKEKEPWFGYIGFIDTHVSWRAKEPWISKYMDKGYSGRFTKVASGQDIGKVATGSLKISDADKEQIRALYDSNVSYQDQKLGELLARLKELGIADDTMLIITADHGDELFEDGRVGHGASLREPLVHVPLVIHYPKMFPGKSIDEGADTVDIVPTLADAFGVEMDESWQGESLLPLANGVGAGYPRMSFASQYEDRHVGRIGHWKLRVAGSSSPRVYDLKADPEERNDVSADHGIEARMLADAYWLMRAYNSEWKKWQWGNAANVKPAFAKHFGE